MLKVHRNPFFCLGGMQGFSPINTLIPLEQKDSWRPNKLTSCPFLALTGRKGALLRSVGRDEVEWSNIPNHKCVLETLCHVKVALRA